ncbi:hypothetical protein BpHYR1_005020, partial [Brachionus plicatilis]
CSVCSGRSGKISLVPEFIFSSDRSILFSIHTLSFKLSNDTRMTKHCMKYIVSTQYESIST